MTENELTHRASPLVAKHREIKAKMDNLQSQLDEVRDTIGKIITEEGGYKDDLGYAEFRTRRGYPSYSSKAVEKYAQVWASSDDPTLAQCGQLLLAERSVTPDKISLYIK